MEREAGDQQHRSPYYDPPDAGIGGEGPIVDLTDLAASSDTEIAQAVHDALLLDPDVAAEGLTIAVENGVVRLGGRPRSARDRERAVDTANLVHGVRRTVDQMEGER